MYPSFPTKPLHIVRLDGMHTPAPYLPNSLPHTYVSYPTTPPDFALIVSRLASADICITTRVPISSHTLSLLPNLKLISIMAVGTDMIDLQACKERGVRVVNVPGASNECVAEHAIGLYFALRRRIVRMHGVVVDHAGLWEERGSLKDVFGDVPRTCGEEVVGILGGGELGTRVSTICTSLGMTVQISEHKSVPPHLTRPTRTPFPEILRKSTVLFLTLPLTPETQNLLAEEEFKVMRRDCVIVNVARGGIVDEEALVKALREGRVEGAGVDVFQTEPATPLTSPLIRAAQEWATAAATTITTSSSPSNPPNPINQSPTPPNTNPSESEVAQPSTPLTARDPSDLHGRLILTPHLAWYGRSSIEKLRVEVGLNIEAWTRGEGRNVVV